MARQAPEHRHAQQQRQRARKDRQPPGGRRGAEQRRAHALDVRGERIPGQQFARIVPAPSRARTRSGSGRRATTAVARRPVRGRARKPGAPPAAIPAPPPAGTAGRTSAQPAAGRPAPRPAPAPPAPPPRRRTRRHGPGSWSVTGASTSTLLGRATLPSRPALSGIAPVPRLSASANAVHGHSAAAKNGTKPGPAASGRRTLSTSTKTTA